MGSSRRRLGRVRERSPGAMAAHAPGTIASGISAKRSCWIRARWRCAKQLLEGVGAFFVQLLVEQAADHGVAGHGNGVHEVVRLQPLVPPEFLVPHGTGVGGGGLSDELRSKSKCG